MVNALSLILQTARYLEAGPELAAATAERTIATANFRRRITAQVVLATLSGPQCWRLVSVPAARTFPEALQTLRSARSYILPPLHRALEAVR